MSDTQTPKTLGNWDEIDSLLNQWCNWKRENAPDIVVYVIEDDGSDNVRIEYTEERAMMSLQYADVERSALSPRH